MAFDYHLPSKPIDPDLISREAAAAVVRLRRPQELDRMAIEGRLPTVPLQFTLRACTCVVKLRRSPLRMQGKHPGGPASIALPGKEVARIRMRNGRPPPEAPEASPAAPSTARLYRPYDGRTSFFQGAGLTWDDAVSVEKPPDVPEWKLVVNECLSQPKMKLTDWERSFLETISRQMTISRSSGSISSASLQGADWHRMPRKP